MRPSSSSPTDAWVASAVGVATLVFQLPFFDRWFSAMDEGHMLAFAGLVNEGALLYRDATIYPLPGAFYLLAAIFQIGEPSILLSRWIVVIEFALFVALVFVWLRRGLPRAWALVAVLGLWLYRIWAFPHWHLYSYSTTTLLLLVVCFLLVPRAIDRRDARALIPAGVVYGLAVFCKQDYGAAGLLAGTVQAGVENERRLLGSAARLICRSDSSTPMSAKTRRA